MEPQEKSVKYSLMHMPNYLGVRFDYFAPGMLNNTKFILRIHHSNQHLPAILMEHGSLALMVLLATHWYSMSVVRLESK